MKPQKSDNHLARYMHRGMDAQAFLGVFMETKHTPGPWIRGALSYRIETNHRIENGEEQHDLITEVASDNVADYNLIAAAPELLKACQHGIDECMRAYKMTSILETQDHKYGAGLNELVMRLNEVLKEACAKATGGGK